MAMFGGMNLLSGAPMFQVRPQAGFVGGMNPVQQQSAQDYFDRVAAMQAEERARNDARRSDRLDRQFQNREMSLKELLGNSSIQDAAEQRQIARDRLGLDANTAASDADLRRNALSLQERLGLMGEDRMSNSDAAQNALAMQKFENDRFNQDRSFTQLSKEQQTNRDLAIKEMEQRRAMAEMPYNQMTQADAAQMQLGNRRLAQEGDLARLPYQQQTVADLWRNKLAEKQQGLDQQNFDATRADRRFEFGNLSKAQEEQGKLEKLKMALTERLAEHPWTKGLTDAQRADIVQRGLDRDQSKQQFGDNLEQRKAEFNQGQQNWSNEFSNKWTKLTPAEKARKDSDTLDRRLKEAMHADEVNYRNDHLKTVEQGNLLHFLSSVDGADPATVASAMNLARKSFGGNGPLLNQGQMAMDNLTNQKMREDVKKITGFDKPTTAEQAIAYEKAKAQSLADNYHAGEKGFELPDILRKAEQEDSNPYKIPGSPSVKATVMELLKAQMRQNRVREENRKFIDANQQYNR